MYILCALLMADYYGDGGLDGGVGGGGGGGSGSGGSVAGGGSSHFRPDPLGSDTSFHGHGRPPYTPIGKYPPLFTDLQTSDLRAF